MSIKPAQSAKNPAPALILQDVESTVEQNNPDSYQASSPKSETPTPPLLPSLFTAPQATTNEGTSDTAAAPLVCNQTVNLSSTWTNEFKYNGTASGQMIIPNIEKVIAALSNPLSGGFKNIFKGVVSAETTLNDDGSYTYFIHNTEMADAYVGHRVKFTVTRREDGVTIEWANYGPQPADEPEAATIMSYYSTFTSNHVVWNFTQVEDSPVYNVSYRATSQTYFHNPSAAMGAKMVGMPEKIKSQFDGNMRGAFNRARALFAPAPSST